MIRIVTFILLLILIVSCKTERSAEENSHLPESPEKSRRSTDTIKELLKVTNPAEGQLIASPLEVKGEARGYWFFEANSTVELLDENMNQISESYITANGDWMTEDWVPFSGKINFENPSTRNGFLIFHKANASGLKEHAMSDTIAIRFK